MHNLDTLLNDLVILDLIPTSAKVVFTMKYDGSYYET